MTEFAVAAGLAETVRAAADVLAADGSAVDAVIAGALMAAVAEPVLCGLMGGGFLMVAPASGKPALLDFFVQTPRRKRAEADLDFREIEADFGSVRQAFHIGAGAIATPGVAPGLSEAHARQGRMPLPELAAPAIAAARSGVRVTEFQARLSQIVSPILLGSDGARALWTEDGDLRAAGRTAANPALADVIEVWAHEGPRFMTEGEPAQALVELCHSGGHLTADDLRRYRPLWRTPLMQKRGGADVALNPAPALGGMLIAFALELAGRDPDSAELARVFDATGRARIECMLHEDPDGGVRQLFSEDLIDRYRRALMGRRGQVRGTTHISAIDRRGTGAALTVSNGEGCGLVLPGTGIMPNNMLGEDDLVPGDWLGWTPDTRLSSMMAPMAASWPDGRRVMLGSGGSNRIRSALAQVLIGLTDRDLPLDVAIAAPRIHVEQGEREPQVDAELSGLGEREREGLLRAYPETRFWDEPSMFFGGVHAVARDARGRLSACGDPRRAGTGLTG